MNRQKRPGAHTKGNGRRKTEIKSEDTRRSIGRKRQRRQQRKMAKIYANALCIFTEKIKKSKDAEEEKRGLLEKAKEAAKAADDAMQAALKKKDREGYKKAIANKQDAEGDAQYYKGLLSVKEEQSEAEKENFRQIAQALHDEKVRKKDECQQGIENRFLEILDYVLQCQNEIDFLHWAEWAYRKELLGDPAQYDPLCQEKPPIISAIDRVAKQICLNNDRIKKDIEKIEAVFDKQRAEERRKWGKIGGCDM